MNFINKINYCFFKTRFFIQKERKILITSLCGGLLITLFSGMFLTKSYSNAIQSGIADSVIRFHILANSDETYDQKLKLDVRDAVLAEMREPLKSSRSLEESKKILIENQEKMKNISLSVIHEMGYDYDVHVSLSKDLFPKKTYGDVVFPAGIYDAVRIEIGNAKGQNWWCVMFPPLCFVDISCEELSTDSKQNLKEVLTEEEYEVVVKSNTEESIAPKMKFLVVEWWQEWQNNRVQNTTKESKGEIPWQEIKS